MSSSVTEVAPEVAAAPPGRGGGSLWRDAGHDLVRNPLFIVSSLVLLVVASWAAFPSLWTSEPACRVAINRQPPAWWPGALPPGVTADMIEPGHIFGTDVLGCDMYSQIIIGARPSMVIGVLVTALIAVIGTTLGIVSGYYGGWTDTIISRITDVFLGLPFILGAMVFLALIRSQSIWAVMLILTVLGWTTLTRIVRGTVISLRDQDFVEAARAIGSTDSRIIFKHILPNCLAPIIVLCTLYVGINVSAESTLTFLGVGLKPPSVSWGITIAEGQNLATAGYPHLLVFPCIALILTVLSIIVIGDALRDALDPKGR